MRKITSITAVLAPISAALLMGASGCSDAASGLGCEGDLKAKVDGIKVAANTLVTVAGSFRADLATACAAIATAGGTATTAPQNPSDNDVKTACTAAEAAMTAKLSAAGTITLRISPAVCKIDASVQASCEGGCKAEVSCTEPELSARCTGGELSVKCEGTCSGSATCEATATVQADCQGSCSATCTGTCSGTCTGKCEGTCMGGTSSDGSCNGTCTGTCTGQCSASCTGKCSGKCELEANANVMCMAEARCEGTCTGNATAPKCEGTLTPPMCEGDASCEASCKGDAELKAQCTPPSVEFVATGMVDAAFITALEVNLPKIVNVKAKADLAAQGISGIVTNFQGLVEGSATCAASVGGEIKAALEASASVSASVSVSASASGKASTG